MNIIIETIKITRPLNVFISFISIVVGALVSGNFKLSIILLFAGLTAALITAGANIINDIFDIEIDRINKPDRSLPSGRISIEYARNLFIICYLSGLIFAAFCGKIMLIIAIIIALLLYWYSLVLKKTILWGNLMVSIISGFTFIYGAMSVGGWRGGIMPAVLAFFFHLGRELVKDMQDIEGDIVGNAITFSGKFGVEKTVFLTRSVFIVLIIITIIPFFLGIYNENYLFIVILGVDTILIYVIFSLNRNNSFTQLGKISNLLKFDMLIGLLAIYLGL